MWEKLLNAKRIRQSTSKRSAPSRTDFHRDYDRIVFSSAFRSLQQKTQVIPFPQVDFVHSRLTHSLETASVGRSLGSMFYAGIVDNYQHMQKELDDLNITEAEFGGIVAAAALAHDIGNPPFGHSGEDAISDFFLGEGKALIEGLEDAQKADFQQYEGNAYGFRVLCHTPPHVSDLSGGLNLTAATLAAFSKYPCLATEADKSLGQASRKKYGILQGEKAVFEQVFEGCGLKTPGEDHAQRHPLAFLTEAADDICYHIIDLEDATRLGWVSLREAESLLLPLLKDASVKTYRQFHETHEKLGYLRALAINALVYEAVEKAVEVAPLLVSGQFDQALTDHLSISPRLQEIKAFSIQHIYRHPSVIENEVAGYKVLHGLLSLFSQAVAEPKSQMGRKMKGLLPERYTQRTGQYESLMGIVEYIGSLSDKAALVLYRKLNGLD